MYILVLCYFTSVNFSCCEPFLQDDYMENKLCFLRDEQSGLFNETEEGTIAFTICGSMASSSVTDTYHQRAAHSLNTTSAAGAPYTTNHLKCQLSSIITPSAKTTHPTPPNHSNSQNLSPSTQQNNNSSLIWGLVVGVVILFMAIILLLAPACVILVVKKSKHNAWILCKEHF